MKFQDPRQKLEELEHDYTLDQIELGKIIIIASLTLLIISVHTLMQIQPAIEEAETAEQRLSQLDSVVNTAQFNDSLQALQDLEGTSMGDRMEYALSTFEGMQVTVQDQKNIYSQLEKTHETYQWLVLISIIGLVTGIAVIYV